MSQSRWAVEGGRKSKGGDLFNESPDRIEDSLLRVGAGLGCGQLALGLLAAILGIIAYNFFVTKVDNFTYMIDEASYSVVEILSTKTTD